MRRNNVALRLQGSLLDEAKRAAASEGVALNQFINVAVAEKLATIRTIEYFRRRAERGDPKEAERLLAFFGRGNPPQAGDEIDDLPPKRAPKSAAPRPRPATRGAVSRRGRSKDKA